MTYLTILSVSWVACEVIFHGWMLWRDGQADASWVEGTWRIENGVITRVQDRDAAALGVDLTGFAIPGLVDVHAHVGVAKEGFLGQAGQEEQLKADLATGVLAIRDCGTPVDVSWVRERADMPRLLHAGHHLARFKRYIRGMADEVTPADLPQAAYAQARAGDGWVKLVGDWIDRSNGKDSNLDPLWPAEALKDAVAAAHEGGAKVTVHSFAHATIDDLLDAGVDGIEHATGMDADQLDQACRMHLMVTPTLKQIDLFDGFARQAGTKYPVYAKTMRDMFERRREHEQMLFDACLSGRGLRLLPGTDSGSFQPHGSLPGELSAWEALGVQASKIIDMATWQARDAIGWDSLSEAASADLVVYDQDPRSSTAVLQHPQTVIVRGRVVAGERDWASM